nr:MAG TPA: hypothetical protein [Caudoviricetes sp.]
MYWLIKLLLLLYIIEEGRSFLPTSHVLNLFDYSVRSDCIFILI